MLNKLCRIVIGIFIICLVLFGIYKILPKQYSGLIDQAYQQMTDSNAKKIANVYKGAKVTNNPDYTYGQILTENCSNPSWYVETIDKTNGKYKVKADGYKVTINMIKDDGSSETKVYTRCHIQLVFDVTYTPDKATIDKLTVYINDQEQTDYYKQAALDSLCRDMK